VSQPHLVPDPARQDSKYFWCLWQCVTQLGNLPSEGRRGAGGALCPVVCAGGELEEICVTEL